MAAIRMLRERWRAQVRRRGMNPAGSLSITSSEPERFGAAPDTKILESTTFGQFLYPPDALCEKVHCKGEHRGSFAHMTLAAAFSFRQPFPRSGLDFAGARNSLSCLHDCRDICL